MKIFGTVISTIKSFIEEYQPKELTFSAQKEEGDDNFLANTDDTTRSSLYDKLVSRLSRDYKFITHKSDTGYAFSFAIVF